VLASAVANAIEDWTPDAVFVDSGAGAGVIDRLRQLRHTPIEVPFGGRATRTDKYVNRRTEMWFAMRDWLAAGGAIPNDPSLKQELATPIYSFDASGRLVLESKDEIRRRMPGAGSPDIADALALTFAAPVAARTAFEVLEDHYRQQRRRRDYDPIDYARRRREGHDPLAARVRTGGR
jgi:hypothetical protein